jgi:hypothetical protein
MSFRTQTAAEGDFRAYSPSTRADFSCAGETEGMPDRGGAPNAGASAHEPRDSAQAPSCFRDWVPEKGKSAIAIARLSGKERNFSGEQFCARGYAASTVGFGKTDPPKNQ